MSYAAAKKKNMSLVEACRKKDKAWALAVCGARATARKFPFLPVSRSLADASVVATPALADIAACDETGWTPLHYAAAFGWVDVKDALLAKG